MTVSPVLMEAELLYKLCFFLDCRALLNVLMKVSGGKHLLCSISVYWKTVELFQSELSDWTKYLGSTKSNTFLCKTARVNLPSLVQSAFSMRQFYFFSLLFSTTVPAIEGACASVWHAESVSLIWAHIVLILNSPLAHRKTLYARHNSSVNFMLHNLCLPRLQALGRWVLPYSREEVRWCGEVLQSVNWQGFA